MLNTKIKLAAAILALAVASHILYKNKKRKRRWWVRPWLKNAGKGNLEITNEFLNASDYKSYNNFLRMDVATFEKLFNLMKHKLEKKDTKLRNCIPAKSKLIITLRYLATGESFRSLMYNYRISESAISMFIPVVCKVIYDELKNEYLKVPNTAAEWLNISEEFENLWNLPHIIGAMDGKHIIIKAPGDEGSAFYNYKNQHSIVLLAMVDANYKFTYINIGTNGRISDGGVYRDSDLYQAIERNMLNLPEDKPLPSRHISVPYMIAADAAFPLSEHIIKPYPFKNMTIEQRIFNYRLSRVRRVVENTFGILVNRFRVLLNVSALSYKKTTIVVQACCALHNFLRTELKSPWAERELENKHSVLFGLSAKSSSNRCKNVALRIRDEFKEYVNGVGAVPWQDEMV